MLTKIPIATSDPKIRECYIEVGDTWDATAGVFPSRFVIEFTEPVDRIAFPTDVAAGLAAEAKCSATIPPLLLTKVFPMVEHLVTS